MQLTNSSWSETFLKIYISAFWHKEVIVYILSYIDMIKNLDFVFLMEGGGGVNPHYPFETWRETPTKRKLSDNVIRFKWVVTLYILDI